MHDAVSAEKAGIAATAIITDRFVQTAEAMANVTGMPGYPFVVISHPIANNDDDVLRVKAQEAVDQCLSILQER
ncbi:hypothetical protein C2W62_01615 [Candidatus Entotheonella serta]|nr:hypothetical protein C2W62_01615 [Candidatus Entotheonella serta]